MSMELPRQLTSALLRRAADEYGTPLYITCAETIRDRHARLRDAFPEARIQYAAKANTNPHVLGILKDLGCSVDAVSLGEILAAEHAGFSDDRIMYTGVNAPDEELREVLRREVIVNADCETDIERIARLAPGREMGLRINPEIGAGHHRHVMTGCAGSKFGIPASRFAEAFGRARELGLDPIGIHMHIGSGITDPGPLVRAARKLAEILERLEETGFTPRYVDVGGGLGVPVRPGDAPLDLRALAGGIRSALRTDAQLVIEPGRFLVAESTILLARVTTIKDDFVGTDAGINTLLRPALYDAYHHISNLSRPEAPLREVTVAGPICESSDVLGRSRSIADPRPGDLLVVHTAGAYGFSMSSRYNSRPLPAEALVDGERSDVEDHEAPVNGKGEDGGKEWETPSRKSGNGRANRVRLIRERESYADLLGRIV